MALYSLMITGRFYYAAIFGAVAHAAASANRLISSQLYGVGANHGKLPLVDLFFRQRQADGRRPGDGSRLSDGQVGAQEHRALHPLTSRIDL